MRLMSVWTSAIVAGHEQRGDAGQGDERLDVGRVLEEHVRARDEVDAGGHHRRRVDQRRDRRRALHGVGKPGVERDLGRLRHGADEEQERDPVGRRRPLRPSGRRPGRTPPGTRPCPRSLHQDEDRDRDAHVADRVHHERLLGGVDRRLALVPEPDQEIRREADQPPAGEEQREVRRHDQEEHREQEEVQVDEEPPLLGVAVHVADRVGDDQHPDPRDDQHLDERERVDQDVERDAEAPGRRPGVEREDVLAGAVVVELRLVVELVGHGQRRSEADQGEARAGPGGELA